MAGGTRKLKCPSCEREVEIGPDEDPSDLLCPHCRAEFSSSALQDATQIAEELVPGFRPGQKLGNYVIEALLGSGGMAVVFRGTQVSLNRRVAIKVLPKHFSKKKVFVERFESEAAVLASLNHPNIVGVIDRGVENDIYFIVMEYIEGDTLKQRLASTEGLLPDEICNIAQQSLRGLEYAHRRGVVHRDIKPGNIMINRENVVKIADFGLAHLAKTQGGLDVTREGQSMGTVKYMAPEQLTSAKHVDGRADVYSFGVCLYEMLTGKLPLGTFKMPSEHNPELDARWDDVIVKALRMEPDERYASAAEMAEAIHEIATTERVTASDREAEEESEINREAAAALVACTRCGYVSGPTATECEKCGRPLSDIFDKCPHCGQLNRLDVAECSKCGGDLESARAERRREAETIQTRAKELARKKEFDAALAEVAKLTRFTSREYAAVRASAQLWSKRITEKKEQYQSQIYEAGCRFIAERGFEKALQLWRALPDDYKDVGARRKEMLARRDEARTALAEGRAHFHAGRYEAALKALEKAQDFWPDDKRLADYLVQTRIKIGNRNLKKTYLAEARQAMAAGDAIRARALCDRVLHLDPDDSTALGFIEEMESGLDAGSDITDPFAGLDFTMVGGRPRRRSTASARKTVAGVLAALGVGALVIIIILIAAASAKARETEAEKILRAAARCRDYHDLDAALKHIRSLLADYPSTRAAGEARELRDEIAALRAASRAVLNKANRALDDDTPEARARAFHLYRRALDDPAVRAVAGDVELARRRLELLRKRIADDVVARGRRLEAENQWRAALALYDKAVSEFAIKSESVVSRRAVAKQRVAEADALLARARKHAENREWEQAAGACTKLLGLMPDDEAAHALLVRVAPNLTPPEGMVYVPAGTYTIGGTRQRPERKVSFPCGFFIDKHEVTCARYARFLAAARRRPPPGWPRSGRPPRGAGNLPVTGVTWEDARAFAEWAGAALPTEAEWEAAARGKKGAPYPWGSAFKSAAVLAYRLMPVGSAKDDRSPVGCLDMAGNAAEWTATPAQRPPVRRKQRGRRAGPPPAAAPPPVPDIPKPGAGGLPGRPDARYQPPPAPEDVAPLRTPADRGGGCHIVKGASWTGPAKDRPTPMVPVGNKGARRTAQWVLTADPEQPDVAVVSGAGLEIYYLGVSGSPRFARVGLRVWKPEWHAWAEAHFPVEIGGRIRYEGRIPVIQGKRGGASRGSSRKPAARKVTLDSGCTLLRHEPNHWIEIRNPFGLVERLPRDDRKRPDPVRISDPDEGTPRSKLSLADVSRSAARMIGRDDRRYINVGFRCVKRIWPRH